MPLGVTPAPAGKTVAGTSTPTTKDKCDGNIYFECTICQKKVASRGRDDVSFMTPYCTDCIQQICPTSEWMPRTWNRFPTRGSAQCHSQEQVGLPLKQSWQSLTCVITRLGAEADRAGSPLLGSDYGSPSQEAVNGRGKGKAKNGKKINGSCETPRVSYTG